MTKSEIKKLDKEFSAKVRERGKCARCGKSSGVQLQCAHIFSRRHRAIRWDENNAICLCAGCHFWAHQNPILFSVLVKDCIGQEKFDKLLFAANAVISKYGEAK